jgi:hypothetical protein
MSVSDWIGAAFVALLLITAGVALITALPTPEKSTARTHYVLSFVASLVLLAAYWNHSAIYGMQGFPYSDDRTYHVQGQSLAESGNLANAWTSEDRNPGFVVWTAVVYRIFGPSTIIVRLFNICFRCLWIAPIAFLAVLYKDPKVTRIAIRLVAWAPSAMLISLLHVKDVLASLGFLCAIAAIAYMGRSRFALPLLAGSAVLLWGVREDLLLLIAPLACIFAVRSMRQRGRRWGGILVLVCAGLFVAITVPLLLDSWILTTYKTSLLTQVFEYTNRNAVAAHGLAPLMIRSVSDFWKLPFSMTAELVLPFPPDFSAADIFPVANGFASLFVLALLPFVFAGCMTSMRKWTMSSLPAYGGFLGCAALLAVVFPGTSRYREQLIGLFCLLAALGIRHWRSHKYLVAGSAFCIGCALAAGTAMYL